MAPQTTTVRHDRRRLAFVGGKIHDF